MGMRYYGVLLRFLGDYVLLLLLITWSSGRSLDKRMDLSTASIGRTASTWVVAELPTPGLWQM